MRDVTYHCDRCGSIVLTDRTLLKIECGPLRQHVAEVDLCPGCAGAFAGFLRQPEVDDAMRSGPRGERPEPALAR